MSAMPGQGRSRWEAFKHRWEQARRFVRGPLISVWALTSRSWGRLLRPGAGVTGLVVLLSGIASFMQAKELPGESAWESGAPARTVLAILGVLAALLTFLVVTGYMRRIRKESEADHFLGACRSAFNLIHEETGIPSANLGAHVWTVTGFPGGKYMVNRASFRTHARALPSTRWTKGKGAIGRCWGSGVESVDDLESFNSAYKSKEEFETRSWEERLGMRWGDYLQSRDFMAIWVTPIFRGPEGKRRFGGCLSVDIVEHPNAAKQLDQVTRTKKIELDGIVAVCHTVLP